MAKKEGFFTREDFDKVGMKKLSLIGIIILAFIALVFLVTRPAPAPGVSAAGTINFAINSNVSSVPQGGVIAAQVTTSSASDLYGVDVSIVYNGSLLNYTGYSEGTFLNGSGTVPTYVPDTYTHYSNNISHLVITRLGNVSGANGNGTIMTVYFKSLAQGTSPLNLAVVASDSNNGSISINSLTNTSVTVSPPGADTTPPGVILKSPSNNYSTSNVNVTFDVTADDNIKVSNVSLYGNWGGRWSAKETNSSPKNSATIPESFTITNIPEGRYSWNAYACDNSSNCAFGIASGGQGIANDTLTVDTTPPYLKINSPTNTTLTNSNITVNLSFTDNLGLATCSYNITNTTGGTIIPNNAVPCTLNHIEHEKLNLTTGKTYSFIINSFDNDTAGNSNYTKTFFSINVPTPTTPSSGGGSTSSGGGGGSSSTTTTGNSGTSNSSVTPSVPVGSETHTSIAISKSMLYFSADTGIKQIALRFKKPTAGVTITVNEFNSLPISVPLNTKVYRYLHISLNNAGNNFGNATTTVEVPMAWLKQNGVSAQDIALYEFGENATQWKQLDTVYNSSDEKYAYYTVYQTGFSYFAIAQKITHLYLYLGIIGVALFGIIIIFIIIRETEKRKGRENMMQNLSSNNS